MLVPHDPWEAVTNNMSVPSFTCNVGVDGYMSNAVDINAMNSTWWKPRHNAVFMKIHKTCYLGSFTLWRDKGPNEHFSPNLVF